MMKTTTSIIDEEYEYFRDKAYIEAERYEKQTQIMQELFEMEYAKVIVGKVRRRHKNIQHATVTTRAKLPRFMRFQSHNRRVRAATDLWNRSKSPIHIGMPF